MDVVLEILIHYLPIFAFSGLLKFDMKMFVNVARLEMGHDYSRSEAGASVYFGHISSLFGNT